MYLAILRKLLFLFFVTIACLLGTKIYADAPFITDDPETMDPGHEQLNIYANATKASTFANYQAPAFEWDFGIIPNVEIDTYLPLNIDVNASRQYRSIYPNSTGAGDLDVELKYRFIQESTYFPQVAFVPNFYVPTGNANQGLGNGKSWYTLPLTMKKSFSGNWSSYLEVGWGFNGTGHAYNFMFGGCVIQKMLNDKWLLGTEIYSQGRTSVFDHAYTLLNLGAVYSITKNFSVEGSIGHSFIGQSHLQAYVALQWND